MLLLCSIALFVSFLFGPQALLAQHKVDTAFHGERLIALVPMVGTGTAQDPKRPLFAPIPAVPRAGAPVIPYKPDELAITGFTYELSDDGKTALIEFVARDPRAFAAIKSASRPDVKVFPRNQATLADVEREFKKVKPGFDIRKFGGGAR